MKHPEVLAGLLLLAFVLGRGAIRLSRPTPTSRGGDRRYRRYMGSAAWRRKRRACLRAAGYRCRVRGCWARARHAHHPRYPKRLGSEPWWELVALCRPHHRQIHARERRLRAWGLPRPAALEQATADIVAGRVRWAA